MFVLINRHGTRRCGGFFAIRLFFSVCPFSLKIMFVEDLWLTIYTRFVMNDLWRKVVSMMKKKCMITFYIPTPHRYPNHEAKKELYIHLWQYTKRPLFFFFLRPEEHGVNLILGFFDIRIPERFQKLVKCGVVLGWNLDTDEDFADVYQKSKKN